MVGRARLGRAHGLWRDRPAIRRGSALVGRPTRLLPYGTLCTLCCFDGWKGEVGRLVGCGSKDMESIEGNAIARHVRGAEPAALIRTKEAKKPNPTTLTSKCFRLKHIETPIHLSSQVLSIFPSPPYPYIHPPSYSTPRHPYPPYNTPPKNFLNRSLPSHPHSLITA